MVDYDCMGNMEGHLANATATHWWKSPRWIVIRIEALAVMAIIFSFFLASFGSCRRWSNTWIVQKGFFVAQVLSLSLGTYSIGLMQSSSVKSEMYPIWTVSLFTLFGCIDPVTTYNGLDYKGPLSKMVYGICLNFGYVMLMSISTISNVVGNTAIITLSTITFIKGFHRSFALVEQKKLCDMVYTSPCPVDAHIFRKDERWSIIAKIDRGICGTDIEASTRNNKVKWLLSCYDPWIALCLSHQLRRYFFGLDFRLLVPMTTKDMDLKWALKVIEIELAFMYDAFFTGNPFLHYYQAKTTSLWSMASLTGICFVVVATAIPRGMSSRRPGASGGCTKVVDTTTTDLSITFVILVSMALLQMMQLVWSWTSNWARAAVVCAYTRKYTRKYVENKGVVSESLQGGHLKVSGWMRLKALVATSTNLFDKYLWQDKIGQYSMLPEPRLLTGGQKKGEGISSSETEGEWKWRRLLIGWWKRKDEQGHTKAESIHWRCGHLVQTLGLHYIWLVIWELFSSDTNKRGGVKLDEDVKSSVIDFLAQIHGDTLSRNWSLSLPEEPRIRHFLPQLNVQLLRPEDHCYRYISCVMTWHIVTWYCELEEQKKEDALMSKQAEAPICCGRETAATIRRCSVQRRGDREDEGGKARDHRRVANALSQYCVYLVKSAPELLPGPATWTKSVYHHFARDAKVIITNDTNTICGSIVCEPWESQDRSDKETHPLISNSKALAMLLMDGRGSGELWKTLALVWVQLLVYAAPYGNAEAHMRHLSQGGEYITHLWALLYHLDIREWKVDLEVNNVHDISTVEDAKTILNDDNHDLDIVVFFVKSDLLQLNRHKFVTASKLVDGVKFYLTSSPDAAKCLFPESILKERSMLFLNRADKKPITYDSEYTPWDIAQFAYVNKLASAKARAQETAPSTSQNPIPTEKQRSEDAAVCLSSCKWSVCPQDGQTVVEITEEIQPPS